MPPLVKRRRKFGCKQTRLLLPFIADVLYQVYGWVTVCVSLHSLLMVIITCRLRMAIQHWLNTYETRASMVNGVGGVCCRNKQVNASRSLGRGGYPQNHLHHHVYSVSLSCRICGPIPQSKIESFILIVDTVTCLSIPSFQLCLPVCLSLSQTTFPWTIYYI